MLDIEMPDLELYSLTGKTVDRAKPVDAFQETKKPAVMLVSLRAGGTGVTLHSADYVFLLDPWWNPAVESQAVDRVHRIGQRKTVFVYRLVTAGTVEDRVQKLKASKRFLFEETMRAAPGGGGLHAVLSLAARVDRPAARQGQRLASVGSEVTRLPLAQVFIIPTDPWGKCGCFIRKKHEVVEV